VNRKTAEKVLAEVKEQFGTDEPKLYDADHEELSEGSWSIAWEGGEEWTYYFRTSVPGVFVEPIASWCLGVYDA
jgi:hypothetical protein